MEDRNKMDQQNRDQETDKKPTQGSQDINRSQQVQPSNVKDTEQGQPGKEKKSA
jgi:hypothetical protein